MAAALAKVVLRGGRSAASSRSLFPAILPHLGSSPAAAPAVGVGRLMHTGLFRPSGVRPQEQLVRMDQFSGKRFMSSERRPRPPPSFVAVGIASVFGMIMMMKATFN